MFTVSLGYLLAISVLLMRRELDSVWHTDHIEVHQIYLFTFVAKSHHLLLERPYYKACLVNSPHSIALHCALF